MTLKEILNIFGLGKEYYPKPIEEPMPKIKHYVHEDNPKYKDIYNQAVKNAFNHDPKPSLNILTSVIENIVNTLSIDPKLPHGLFYERTDFKSEGMLFDNFKLLNKIVNKDGYTIDGFLSCEYATFFQYMSDNPTFNYIVFYRVGTNIYIPKGHIILFFNKEEHFDGIYKSLPHNHYPYDVEKGKYYAKKSALKYVSLLYIHRDVDSNDTNRMLVHDINLVFGSKNRKTDFFYYFVVVNSARRSYYFHNLSMNTINDGVVDNLPMF
ncbi:MAG: hypothetical protein HQK92_02940 [Nitrospirae bacterium]|nr:hypothetical protein [Nitrospirota bacterium]